MLLLVFVQFSRCKPEIVRVNGDEGTPVPIPNTVVKLVYGDNTWLATAREDNSTRTQSKAATSVAAFCFAQIRSDLFSRYMWHTGTTMLQQNTASCFIFEAEKNTDSC